MHYTTPKVYEFISKQTDDPIIERITCAISGERFAIFQSDKEFYKKVSPIFGGKKYLIPFPTLCPEERMRRRMSRKNDHHYFKRTCDFSGKPITTIYHPSVPGPVYKVQHRWGDAWSANDWGKEWNAKIPFFSQYKALHDQVPKIAMVNDNGITSENCEYCQNIAYSKDCYLNTVSRKLRDCYYSSNLATGTWLVDCFFTMDSQICYECIEGYGLYECFYLQNCSDCSTCFFGYELHGCQDCAFCVGLHNKQYCLFNQQLDKDTYLQKLQHIRQEFPHNSKSHFDQRNTYIGTFPRKSLNLINTEQSWGNNLVNAQNTAMSYNLKNVKDCKYWMFGDTGTSGVDLTVGGELELCYESIVPDHSYKCGFTIFCRKCNDVRYSEMCHGCQHCFGCVGLKNKEYCILNKQYTKQAYEQLVPMIIARMHQDKQRGEFFPTSLSPFAYNETIAQDYAPIDPDQTHKYGSTWRHITQECNVPDGITTIDAKTLNQDPEAVNETILQQAILCQETTRPFRIMPQELSFYRQHKLPLPQFHPQVRYRKRLARMPAKTLYLRTGDLPTGQTEKNGEEILSVYPPDTPFKVYSEKTYRQQIFG